MNFTGNANAGFGGGFQQSQPQQQQGAGRGFNPRGRGGGRGRGRGRGQRGGGGAGRGSGAPGGLKIANNVAVFDLGVDAHVMPNRTGIQALCASEQNSTVFTGGLDGAVKMFNINDGSSTEQQEGQEVTSLYLFGSWLFVGYTKEVNGALIGFVKSYNFATSPPETYSLEIDETFPAAHRGRVSCIAVGGDILFTGGEDSAVRGWKLDGKAWKMIGSLGGQTAHNSGVWKMAVVNNNLFTGACNGEIKVWSLSGHLQSQFQAHQDMVTGICGWSNNGQSVLLTCSSDQTIKVWDLQAGKGIVPAGAQPIFSYPPPQSVGARKPKTFTCMATHVLQNQTNVLICGAADGSIQILDLPDFTDLGFLSGHVRHAPITGFAVVPTKSLLFVGSLTGKLNCFKFVS